MDPRFRHPFRLILSGPPSSGKTSFISKLLLNKHLLINPVPKQIHFYYQEWQQLYDILKSNSKIKFHEGMPNVEEFTRLASPCRDTQGSIFIFDDGMSHLNEELIKIFSVCSRHNNSSAIFITHNLFGNKDMRAISLQSNYFVIMKSPKDDLQVRNLASQSTGLKDILIKAYLQVTEKLYSYILVDLHQLTKNDFRIRANILPTEWPMEVFMKDSAVNISNVVTRSRNDSSSGDE